MKPSEFLSQKLASRRENTAPPARTFREFLKRHARVKQGAHYVRYHFTGREALAQIVDRIDSILGSSDSINEAMADASLAICGGAQFGKTVLMLNLLVYLTAVRFRNVGYYLPDDDLVQGIVDGKLRPDVLDQIPEIARLIELGKTLNATGRAVHRKGALLVTDGERTALAYLRGMGKVPTTFSMDVVIQDEKDDIAEQNAKFLAGRLTASDLRFSLSIGTQRYHGAGQNAEFESGTQHVGVLFPKGEKSTDSEKGSSTDYADFHRLTELREKAADTEPLNNLCPSAKSADHSVAFSGINPEENWPHVCRLSLSGEPHGDDPQLTPEGDFASLATGQRFPVAAMHAPDARVYLADPASGAVFDRRSVQFVARRPEREAQRKWSYRVSQLLIDAIDLKQIVVAWEEAVRDPGKMAAFCTDRLALPRSMSQGLDPAALQRAREARPYSLSLTTPPPPPRDSAMVRYAGLDMGDRCWFVAVEGGWSAGSESGLSTDCTDFHRLTELKKNAADAEPLNNLRQSAKSADNSVAFSVSRVIWTEMLSAERIRTRIPELCTALGVKLLLVDAGPLRDLSRDLCFLLDSEAAPQRWDEKAERWRGMRGGAVEFTLREGQGIRQKPGLTQDGARYPLIACNREETIARVVEEIQHPDEPRLLLPERNAQTPPLLLTYEQHLLAGSRMERAADGKAMRYVDHCENHFLLATAYALLARRIGELDAANTAATPNFARVTLPWRGQTARQRRVIEG